MQKEKKVNYVVKYSENFWEEYNEILEYISDNLYYSTLNKFDKEFFSKIDYLINFPRMYVPYQKNKKYRRVLLRNYVVFYKVYNENKIIEISHIYYNRKNSFKLN